MNLHAIVRGAITTVNPDIFATFKLSIGRTPAGAGKNTPNYTVFNDVRIQVQGFDGDRLKHENNLNIEGVYRSVHMYGNTQGVVRPNQKGGDLLIFPQIPGDAPQTWLVVLVLETWPDWSRVIVCLQND